MPDVVPSHAIARSRRSDRIGSGLRSEVEVAAIANRCTGSSMAELQRVGLSGGGARAAALGPAENRQIARAIGTSSDVGP